jgi:UDP-GlcNAc3NAcA epimerase
LGIPKPEHHLAIGGGSHGENTGRMIEKLEKVLILESPDVVLLYGDTDSTLAGAVATTKLHIPLAHVEAGLRSFNRRMPEEINRILTDHCSDFLYTPTTQATGNLKKEGIPPEKIFQFGDVMFDAVRFHSEQAETTSDILSKLQLVGAKYAIATIDRQDNTDDPERLNSIFSALSRINKNVPVVLPIHPRTLATLKSQEKLYFLDDLTFIEPLGYMDTMKLMNHAAAVITGSGGMQKEAYFHQVPCVTLRDETEWTELIDLGWNRLAPPGEGAENVLASALGALGEHGNKHQQPYGDGHAATYITEHLLNCEGF